MNILYVGPYRQDNYYGLYSQAIIQSLGSKHNLTTRPIFYSASEVQKNLPPILHELEQKRYNHYDCLIQHVEISDILYTNSFDKNIVIPIIDHKYDSYLLNNRCVNEFFIDSTTHKELFPESKTKLFELDLDFSIDRNKIFDIGPLLPMKKMYFSGNYADNTDLILSLIRSFVFLQDDISTDLVLVLFLFNITKDQINQIKDYIKNIYNIFGLKYTIDKIAIVPVGMSILNILSCHNSGDIFLNFNTSSCSTINKTIASKLDKPIIEPASSNFNNLYTNDSPTSSWSFNYTDRDIVNAVTEFFRDKPTKQPIKHKKINNLL